MEAREVVGGIAAIIGVAAIIGLRVYRMEMRAERREQVEVHRDMLRELSKDRMLQLMAQAPDQKRVGEYLAWGVNSFHEEIDGSIESFVGVDYRNAMIDRIFTHAQGEGREDIQRSLDKLRRYVLLSDAEKWWELQPQYIGK